MFPEREQAELLRDLSSWLESERFDYVESFRRDGRSLTRVVHCIYAERKFIAEGRTGTWSLNLLEQKEEQRSVFAGVPRWLPLRVKYRVAPACVLEPGEVELPNYHREFFEQMLGDYLSSLEHLDKPEPGRAEGVVRAYLEYLETKNQSQYHSVSIGGIVPPAEPLENHQPGLDVVVRALTAAELGNHLELAGLPKPSSEPLALIGLAGDWPEQLDRVAPLLAPGCSICFRRSITRGETASDSPSLEAFVLALQLMGYSLCGSGRANSWTEPGPRSGTPCDALLIPKIPEFEEREMSSSALSDAIDLAGRIPLGAFNPTKREDTVLHQFAIGASHERAADSLIAFMVALEALFVPSLAGEATYRFRLNGARFLGDSVDMRREYYENLGQLYRVRSKLVHTGSASETELRDGRRLARSVAATAITRALREGWPSGKDLEMNALL